MTIAKITETRFYDEYRDKKVALLEKGQEVRIHRLHRFDKYHFENVSLTPLTNLKTMVSMMV